MSLIEMMILGFLSERSMCGYELRKKMEQLQGYARKFSDGTVYPGDQSTRRGRLDLRAIRNTRRTPAPRGSPCLRQGRGKLIRRNYATPKASTSLISPDGRLYSLSSASCRIKRTVMQYCAAATIC